VNTTPTEKLPPVTARVGKMPPISPILTIILDPPTVAEAMKQLGFEPNKPFNSGRYEVRMCARDANRVIPPEEFETTFVPDGGVILVMPKVLA